jgi:homoserine dehydrogenase
MKRKKHVVTSNKGPIALAHRELVALAAKKGVALRYEATVCGAIPIIRTLREGLLGNEVKALFGVMNGTCNYILTRMEDEGLTYDQALGEAQEMGYAEKDPTYDVKGLDTALKLVILANTVWGMDAGLGDVQVTVTYTLTDRGELRIDYEGTTDKATILNPTHHSYFNLSGSFADTILGHLLRIDAGELERIHPVSTIFARSPDLALSSTRGSKLPANCGLVMMT